MKNSTATTATAACNPLASTYHFAADALDTFSNLHDWVQVSVALITSFTLIALAYLAHKTVTTSTYHILCCLQFGRRWLDRGM